MNWSRLAEARLRELARQFPAVVVVGPRQVGKTTLARTSFPEAGYKDVESPLVHLRFTEDPAHELELLGDMTILDEAQTVPPPFFLHFGEQSTREGVIESVIFAFLGPHSRR
jgi:predicted AAA+ superfamily ATPase